MVLTREGSREQDASMNESSCPQPQQPVSSAKRKHGNIGAVVHGHAEKKRACDSDRAVDLEEKGQKLLDVSILNLPDEDYGLCVLSKHRVPTQSPYKGDMGLKVNSGTGGPGSGIIRFIGTRHYRGDDSTVILSVPFTHIEQVIMFPNPSVPVSEDEAYQIVIIQTAGGGASAGKRQHPQIISFGWPDKKIDKGLRGTVAEGNGREGTYLSLFKEVLNEQLAPFERAVVDTADGSMKSCTENFSATIRPVTGISAEEKVTGQIYFLNTGLLYSAGKTITYMPFRSIANVIQVIEKDPGHELSNLVLSGDARLDNPTSQSDDIEPHHENQDTSKIDDRRDDNKFTLSSLMDLSPDCRSRIKRYGEKDDISPGECEQTYFYTFGTEKPMTRIISLRNGQVSTSQK